VGIIRDRCSSTLGGGLARKLYRKEHNMVFMYLSSLINYFDGIIILFSVGITNIYFAYRLGTHD